MRSLHIEIVSNYLDPFVRIGFLNVQFSLKHRLAVAARHCVWDKIVIDRCALGT